MRPDLSQVRAILSLLSDENAEIVAQVRKKLFEMGEDTARAVLEASDEGTQARREVERVLHRFKAPPLEDQFQNLPVGPDGDIDLEEGAFTLAKFGYPDIETGHYGSVLDRMASDLAPNIAPDDHPLRVINTLNDYLFDQQGFRGPEGYDPDSSYLNRVIDRRTGLPIAISAVYILLARRLELPIVGIGMPAHFIVKYKESKDQKILIDPFNRGQILTPNECRDMLHELSGKPFPESQEMLPEPTDREILIRMMVNLISGYAASGDQRRAKDLLKFVQILQPPDA